MIDKAKAREVAEYLRRKAAGNLLAADPHMPASETMTAVARALPRMTQLVNTAAAGNVEPHVLAAGAEDVLNDREPWGGQEPPQAAPPPPPTLPVLTTPPVAGVRVHVITEGADATVKSHDPNTGGITVEFDDQSVDTFFLGDLALPQTPPGNPPSGVTVQPGPHGTTAVSGLPSLPATPHNWSLGDRVRSKTNPQHVGTVASLPSGPVIQIASHTLGNEMGVDLDASCGGGRAIADVDQWEAE